MSYTKYYEEGRDNYNMREIIDTDSRVKNIIDAALQHFPKGGKVLDIGCGDFLFQKIFDTTFQMVGLDLNATKNDAVIKHDITNIPYPFADASFDGLICSEVLEHLFDPFCVLKEARRLLKKDGTFIVTVPNFDCLENYITFYRGFLLDPARPHTLEHIRQYNNDNLTKFLKESGFKVVDTMGNSPHMNPLFQNARKVLLTYLQSMTGKPITQITADQIIGRMFPTHCVGLCVIAKPE